MAGVVHIDSRKKEGDEGTEVALFCDSGIFTVKCYLKGELEKTSRTDDFFFASSTYKEWCEEL